MSRIIFAAVFGIIIIGIALFTSKIYGHAFRLGGTRRELTIPAVLFPLTWIASLIAVRSAALGIGPVVYTIINALTGIFFYMFIGAVILSVALAIAFLKSTTLPLFVSWIVLGASLLLAIIGLVQARFITTKSYTVTLENAPEEWNGKTAVLVADTHFGLVNYRSFSDRVVSKIRALNPGFVLHAGDFYDGPSIDTAPITASWKKLTDTVPVFYAPGNHEAYGDYNGFIQSIKDAGVIVLENQKTEFRGVQIAGITYLQRSQAEVAATAMQNMLLDQTKPTILINHPPTFQKEANNFGVDLMVSGHTHRGQFWPVNFLVRMIYKKYTYGLQRYENMQTITTSGVGTFGPPLRLFNTPELVVITFKTK